MRLQSQTEKKIPVLIVLREYQMICITCVKLYRYACTTCIHVFHCTGNSVQINGYNNIIGCEDHIKPIDVVDQYSTKLFELVCTILEIQNNRHLLHSKQLALT